MDEPWSDLEEYAEALLKAEAERRGCSLRELGVLSAARLVRIRKFEVPLSQVMRSLSEDENE